MPKNSKRASLEPKPPKKPSDNFAIVAIGASAGGVEAVSELLKNLSPDTGMGFVLVQHLDPHHHSMLTELLSRHTQMSVSGVTEGAKVERNHIYVIPPNTSMSIRDHMLQLRPRPEGRGVHMPIDFFMRALADANANRCIGVILSGTGTDGTLGMAEIQAQGGVTFAQDDATAKYNSMPRSAVASGCVDYILPPKAIAKELARICAVHHKDGQQAEPAAADGDAPALGIASAREGARMEAAVIARDLAPASATDYRYTAAVPRGVVAIAIQPKRFCFEEPDRRPFAYAVPTRITVDASCD